MRKPAGTAIGDIVGSVGIIAWTSRDDTIPAAVPQPFFDDALDWVWHKWVTVPSAGSASDLPLVHLEIDSKAQRKLGADEGVLIVFQNALTAAGNDYAFGWGARALIKE